MRVVVRVVTEVQVDPSSGKPVMETNRDYLEEEGRMIVEFVREVGEPMR